MSNQRVLWKQVWALGGLQAAITLSWVIYNLYLTDLLGQLGFAAGTAAVVVLIENVLAIAMEPLMGGFSDQLQRTLTTQFPFIFAAIAVASGLFIAIPATVVFGDVGSLSRWLLPLLLVAWALAMSCFRSPALSLLGRYAINSQWAPAAAVLTLLGSFAGSLGPFLKSRLLALGPMVTFAVGSVVLLGAAAGLRAMQPAQSIHVPTPLEGDGEIVLEGHSRLSPIALVLVFLTGAMIALGFRLTLPMFAGILSDRLPPDSPVGVMLGVVFIAQAIAALPAGQAISRWGIPQSMGTALAFLAVWGSAIAVVPMGITTIIAIMLWGLTFSVVATSSVPFALSMVPTDRAGLGTGMYFGGGAAALSGLSLLTQQVSLVTTLSLGLGAIAFVVAIVCVFISARLYPIDATPVKVHQSSAST